MITAIGSASPSSTPGGAPTAIIAAQIARYQKELSNCVNCDSANTREGRDTIQTISNKISVAKARLEELALNKSSTPPDIPKAISSAYFSSSKDTIASSVNNKIGTESVSASDLASTTVGRNLDVFA